MKRKFLSLFLIALATLFAVACQNDDDSTSGFHPNGIKKLTGTPITITPSTYTFGSDSEKTVNSIGLTDIQGVNVLLMESDQQVAISIDDSFEIDGALILVAVSNTDIYQGEDFTVSENGEVYTLTGEVTNDANDTRSLSITLQLSQVLAGNSEYTIQGEQAILTGILGNKTFNQILEINSNHPAVKTFVLTDIPGSINDDINVETGRLIREAGYGTHLLSNSEIYSGGSDLFCSGKTRTSEAGAIIGVHAWCCYEGLPANELPQDSAGHDDLLNYFKEMLGDEKGSGFYFFTINAAPFDGMHLLTDAEIAQYNVVTD